MKKYIFSVLLVAFFGVAELQAWDGAGWDTGLGVLSNPSTITAIEGTDASFVLKADDGDDTADTWTIRSDASDNRFYFTRGVTDVANITGTGDFTITNLLGNSVYTDSVFSLAGGTTAIKVLGEARTATATNIELGGRTHTNGSSTTVTSVAIIPTYNQTSTAAATDFQIKRTETAIGTGAQKMFSLLAGASGTTEMYFVNNKGIRGGAMGSAVASATTIAPTGPYFHVTGVTDVVTITAPAECTAGCEITIIPDGVFATTTAGNIALASTAVVNKALRMVYDAATVKWYPSY